MTSNEILDRLVDIIRDRSGSTVEEVIEAMHLIQDLRDRLNCDIESLSFTVTGNPETLAMAIGQVITTTASPKDLEQLRRDVVDSVTRKPA